MKFKSEFLNEIYERGFIYQDTEIDNLDQILSKNKICGYSVISIQMWLQ